MKKQLHIAAAESNDLRDYPLKLEDGLGQLSSVSCISIVWWFQEFFQARTQAKSKPQQG